jgi:WD40 repeat protein/energy-coupling factor transporter ATP-binding protein EcfA2
MILSNTSILNQPFKERLKQKTNPFPGLRPFGMDESHLFFGREGQSDEVLRKLAENKFIAIIGSSGSGKSSFVYCGVIPILYGGFITEVASNWEVIVARPGNSPIDNLAQAILNKEKTALKNVDEENQLRKTILSTLLRSSSLGLIEALSKITDASNTNVLLVIDQFEELFRFKKSEENAGTSEALAFVNLLLEAVDLKNTSIYVAITMRSDFIGDCAQFPDLTKHINDSNYLIPQMTRDQKRMAISGPIAVGGAKIAPRLLQQLLSDLGDNPDQLPILAHALMRTWDYWENNSDSKELIDLPHYEAIGMMSGALSQHANEAFDELNAKEKEICAILFKCLTEKSGDNDGIRRPTRVDTMANIVGCSPAEIIKIVEVFRKPGRSLLAPPYGITLHENTVIDISHESLMRIWVRLKNWVDEEAQAVDMYLRLSDAAAKYQTGKAGLWRPPDLQLALNWQEKNNPTLEWAQRYHLAFERTMVFLETSKKSFETEQRVKEEMQRRRLRDAKRWSIGLGILTILALVAFVWSIIQQNAAKKAEKLAKESALVAQKQTFIAQKNSREAEKQKRFAQLKEKEAQNQAELARQAALEAEHQKNIAQENLALATRQTKIAEQQRILAQQNAQKAISEQQKAEKASNDALRQRMLSIAQAMAVKSLQIYDTVTRALVAQQSYMFNKEYQGNPHSHDVYDGLYYAVKNLYHDAYNSLKGHTDAVRSVGFSPDGKSMFTAGSDGKIMKWFLQNGRYTGNLFFTNSFINKSLLISPNNKYLAVLSELPYIQLFNLADPMNAQPKRLFGHRGQIWAMVYMPDNINLISVGADSSILLRNIETDKFYLIAKTPEKIKSLAVDSTGKFLLGGDDKGQLHIWDLKKNMNHTVIKPKNFGKVQAVDISKNGKFMVAGDDKGTVKLWKIENASFQLIANLTGHRARINDLKFSNKNDILASASFDGTVRIWNLANLDDQPIVLRDHNSWVWSVAFSQDDSHIIAGCVDNLIRIYPTDISEMANKVCTKLNRNMTPDEWNQFVARDILYRETCNGLPKGKNQILE